MTSINQSEDTTDSQRSKRAIERETRRKATEMHERLAKSEEELSRIREQRAQDSEGLDSHFLCPISFDYMIDPVVAADGNTYDRKSIQRVFETWLDDKISKAEDGYDETELTREPKPRYATPLAHGMLQTNYTMKNMIDEYMRKPENKDKRTEYNKRLRNEHPKDRPYYCTVCEEEYRRLPNEIDGEDARVRRENHEYNNHHNIRGHKVMRDYIDWRRGIRYGHHSDPLDDLGGGGGRRRRRRVDVGVGGADDDPELQAALAQSAAEAAAAAADQQPQPQQQPQQGRTWLTRFGWGGGGGAAAAPQADQQADQQAARRAQMEAERRYWRSGLWGGRKTKKRKGRNKRKKTRRRKQSRTVRKRKTRRR